MHRIGAIITAAYLLWLAIRILMRSQSQLIRQTSALLTLVLAIQVALGVSNIVLSLPLAIAVSHNIVAACLMMVLIKLTYTLKRKI